MPDAQAATKSLVLVRLDHGAGFIEYANHGIVGTAAKLRVSYCVADCVWVTVPQATKRQRIGN